jgi:hypothetical protein
VASGGAVEETSDEDVSACCAASGAASSGSGAIPFLLVAHAGATRAGAAIETTIIVKLTFFKRSSV